MDGSAAATAATTGSSSTSTTSSTTSTSSAGTTSTGTSTTTTTTTQTATPFTLAGTPVTSVIAGAAYSFLPTASSSETTITYTIANQPAWATFNSSTGQLTGTPVIADVGTTTNITISASNGVSSASIGPFSIAVTAGSATLSWSAPVENTDGTILNNLAGYHIYYGTSATALTSQISVTGASVTSYVVNGLAAGTYYFAVTAYSSAGTESVQSDVGTKTI